MQITDLYDRFLECSGISIDSRKIEKNQMFFALKGVNFDGNAFAADALEKGARYAIIDDIQYNSGPQTLLVGNVLQTLQRLAEYHRQNHQWSVFAITGSNGKTTTKELISKVLDNSFKVHSTRGNYNNELGLPLTLLSAPSDADILILEMGASKENDIKFLCELADPEFGLVTNMGSAHLEGFGSSEILRSTKAELYDYLAVHNGTAFINLDEKHLQSRSSHVEKRILYFEAASVDSIDSPYSAVCDQEVPYLRLTTLDEFGKPFEIESKLMGRHNFYNILSALSVGRYYNVPFRKIAGAISFYSPGNMRSHLFKSHGVNYLIDAYNANPSSMNLALETFFKLDHPKKGVVLGAMKELGDYADKAHRDVIIKLKKYDPQLVSLIGEEYRHLKFPEEWHWFETVEECYKWWQERDFKDYWIFLKGSRSAALEKLLPDLPYSI